MVKNKKILTFLVSAIFLTLASSANCQKGSDSLGETTTAKAAAALRQKEHSKLYERYKSERKLSDIATITNDDVTITEGVPQKIFQPGTQRMTAETFINKLGCKSDAVVIGVIKDKTSQLTENEQFVFTDSDLLVEDVLKNNLLAPIQIGALVNITRPGGTVYISGHKISVVDESFKPFTVEGKYLLFLRFIPATGSYQSVSGAGSYELKSEKTIKLTEESLLPQLENGRDSRAFVSDVRRSVSGTCARPDVNRSQLQAVEANRSIRESVSVFDQRLKTLVARNSVVGLGTFFY